MFVSFFFFVVFLLSVRFHTQLEFIVKNNLNSMLKAAIPLPKKQIKALWDSLARHALRFFLSFLSFFFH